MNSYERIQKAIDYIELNLKRPIRLETAAKEACFSLSHFYRMFHALTGYTVKDYIRNRRLHDAAIRLINTDDKIIDICFDYQFEYQESFTRAFKNISGTTPGQYRKTSASVINFPGLNLPELYFESTGNALPDPKIKVLKELKPMRVASYRALSKHPEKVAFRTLMQWAEKNGVLKSSNSFRVFGFDNPSPRPGKPVYGYEFWISVNPDLNESEPVTIKEFSGGKYAVTGTTVAGISESWKHFIRWLKISPYVEGSHQCLEEHLSLTEEPTEKTQIDLFVPLAKAE